MKPIKSFSSTNEQKLLTVDKFISAALQSVAYIHHKHLTTTSYTLHMALDEYYKNAPELIDAIAESYIGAGYVLSDELEFKQPAQHSIEAHLKSLKVFALNAHRTLSNYEEVGIISNIENFVGFVDSILYKLRLK
ncbi:MAG: DUF5856 family protein [Culicoidibacterales bacterium]